MLDYWTTLNLQENRHNRFVIQAGSGKQSRKKESKSTLTAPEAGSGTGTEFRRSRFLRHFLEMVIAMALGMAVFGMLIYGVLSLLGMDDSLGPELDTMLMVFNMSAGMALWMRHRGHAWPGVLEMSGAMFVPFLALFPLFWTDAISEDMMFGLAHVLMLPVMLAIMLRHRHDYAHA